MKTLRLGSDYSASVCRKSISSLILPCWKHKPTQFFEIKAQHLLPPLVKMGKNEAKLFIFKQEFKLTQKVRAYIFIRKEFAEFYAYCQIRHP